MKRCVSQLCTRSPTLLDYSPTSDYSKHLPRESLPELPQQIKHFSTLFRWPRCLVFQEKEEERKKK